MDSEQRAHAARNIMDNPVYREVMSGLREEAIQAWLWTKADDAKQRDFSWITVKVLERIESMFQSIMDDQHISARASVRAPD